MNEKDSNKATSDEPQQQNIYEGGFDHKSPRPPVPGEERSHFMSDWGVPSQMDCTKHKSSSPSPRRFSASANESNPALLGYEPEGSCRPLPSASRPSSRPCPDNPSPPSCLRWAQSLHFLLQDPEGTRLFQQYLKSECPHHADLLDFWFACEGLRKQSTPEMIHRFVKIIYMTFFVRSTLPIDEDLRKEVGKNIKSSQCLEPPVTLFDQAQARVEQLIDETTYPNFLKSDSYLQYLENVQNPSSSSSSDFSSNELSGPLASGSDLLPTLHEDMELIINPPVHISHNSGTGSVSTGYHTPNVGAGGPVRLTKDMLLISQKHRAVDVRPKSETFASMFMYRGGTSLAAHAAYNSYNPVSRQDSELHSLSSHSDARTESDNMSMTDSSIDGRSLGKSSRRKAVLEARKAREYAALNQETHMHQILIPRTQRVDTRQCQPMDKEAFATILIEKLEMVKREQDQQELLDRKLKESESMGSMSDIQSRELANAIREKLQLEDDNDQDILDQHVSRVFSDLTPAMSPGVMSPRPHSPPRNRHMQGYNLRPRRKDKDGFSTFSSDSGNVHDFAEGSEHKIAMVKSKSMPEYPEDRFIRGSTGRRSKKALTDLTDSGVSVVSDTPPVIPPVKDNRVLAWLMESDKSGRGASHTHSEMSLKHRSHRTSSATSPIAGRHRKGFGSRSGSLERNSGAGNLVPAQPFVADPSMPPLPSPNISIQLEEARRRLEDDVRTRGKQRSSGRFYPEVTQSSQSTLRKSMRGSRPSAPAQMATDDVTTVVFSFCEEQFPYRTKIPGTQITLRQFKEYLPKKGNYRYFFKTVCEELGNQVIQEEIINDGDVLPLWEGKVMAQVKPID
ncbi:axin-1 [Anoplophora glabripennis]|uniref:axin-1 n=1 Tax=Anoplophora glabripennis TaxID=217634 RepID=UPI000875776A|nr:axin-1 [Anoplophora glabripennis]